MSTQHVDAALGLDVSIPTGWIFRSLNEQLTLIVPDEYADHDPVTAPVSVLLRRTPLTDGTDLGDAVTALMVRRIGQGRLEMRTLSDANQHMWIGTDWTDGILSIWSSFTEQGGAMIEVAHSVDPNRATITLETLQSIVKVSLK